MKLKDLRVKSVEELKKDFTIFKRELFNLRFQKAQGQTIKTHRVRQLKIAVARVKTLLNEAKLGITSKKVAKKTVDKVKNKVKKTEKKVVTSKEKVIKKDKSKSTKDNKDA